MSNVAKRFELVEDFDNNNNGDDFDKKQKELDFKSKIYSFDTQGKIMVLTNKIQGSCLAYYNYLTEEEQELYRELYRELSNGKTPYFGNYSWNDDIPRDPALMQVVFATQNPEYKIIDANETNEDVIWPLFEDYLFFEDECDLPPHVVVVGDYELSPLGKTSYKILTGNDFNKETIFQHDKALVRLVLRLGECAVSSGTAELVPYHGDHYVVINGQVYDQTNMINDKWSGQFTDPRDGRIYHTIKIGNQTWMAENLRYEGVGIQDRRIRYGSCYSLKEAEQACPAGWHLPTEEEMHYLIGYINHDCDCEDEEEIAKMLKSKSWSPSDYCGSDTYGFNAMPTRRVKKDKEQEILIWDWPNEAEYLGQGSVLCILAKEICIGCPEDRFYAIRCIKD